MSKGLEAAALTPARMYRAVTERDGAFEGHFFVGVTSTGVFCRPGCPAKTPGRERCEFFGTASSALQAGFRPCLRCRPLTPTSGAPAWAEKLVERMVREPERVLSAADIRAAGGEPAQASRFFKARYGASVQALSRARRVGVALEWIRGGTTSGRAAGRAGFTSESGFRKAVRDLFGTTPGEAAKAGAAPVVARWLATPVGPMIAGASEAGVCLLEFVDRRALAAQLGAVRRRLRRPIVPGANAHLAQLERELAGYFAGTLRRFGVALEAPGSAFQERVWEELRRVEPGTTASYVEIARRIGRPTAVRAVARANGDNRIAIIIPCHRVIGEDGALTGYGGGVWRKRWLLDHERGGGPGGSAGKESESLFRRAGAGAGAGA